MDNDDGSVREACLLVDQRVGFPHHGVLVLEGGGARLGRRAFLRRVIPSMVGSGHDRTGSSSSSASPSWGPCRSTSSRPAVSEPCHAACLARQRILPSRRP